MRSAAAHDSQRTQPPPRPGVARSLPPLRRPRLDTDHAEALLRLACRPFGVTQTVTRSIRFLPLRGRCAARRRRGSTVPRPRRLRAWTALTLELFDPLRQRLRPGFRADLTLELLCRIQRLRRCHLPLRRNRTDPAGGDPARRRRQTVDSGFVVEARASHR